MACIEKDTSSTDPDKWLVCELLILLLFFPLERLFSLFVLVQLLKCCEHRGGIGSLEGWGAGLLNVFFVFYVLGGRMSPY